MKNRWKKLLAAAMALTMIFALAVPAAAAESAHRDSFVYATSREPSSLDPAAFQGCYNGYIIDLCIYDTLVKMDNEGNITPHLATEWEYEDDLTLHITIRDDVVFSNGEKLTAEDVLFSVFRLQDPMGMYGATFACLDAENSVAEDDTHLTFKFLTPFAGFMAYMSYGISGVVSKAYVEENGAEALAQNPMGSGPFVFDEWVVGDSVTLSRNDNYWGEEPNFDNLTVRFITDNTTRFMEFETGSVDAIDNLSNADIQTMMDGGVEGTLYQQAGFDQIDLCMTYGYEPFQDVRVRQAFAMAINLDAMVANVFGNTAEVALSYENEGLLGYTETGTYGYDPEGAKALLEEAGYGEGLTLDMTVSSSENFVKMAEILQSFLAEIGVTLNVNVADQSTALFALMGGESVIGFTETTANVLDPSIIFDPLRLAGIHAGARTNSQELDDLLQAGLEAMDETERADIYAQANQMIFDLVSVVPIAGVKCSYATQPYVTNFDDSMTGITDLTVVTFSE